MRARMAGTYTAPIPCSRPKGSHYPAAKTTLKAPENLTGEKAAKDHLGEVFPAHTTGRRSDSIEHTHEEMLDDAAIAPLQR